MKKSRRDFLKLAAAAQVSVAGAAVWQPCGAGQDKNGANAEVVVDHAAATLEDGGRLLIPFWRIDSGRDGPSLLLIAAQHGNEVQGSEVARRFQEVCARQLVAGSVWLIPMANPPAVRKRRHSINLGPEDPITKARLEGHNMNLVWPGNPAGNDTERLAYALDQSVLRHCSHLVDIHCWNHFAAAQTLSTEHEPSYPLGEATTTRFISYRTTPTLQTAGQLMRNRGKGAIEMELSGQFQIQERQVQMGLSSMINIAKRLGLMEGEPEPIRGPRVVQDGKKNHDIQAPCSGIFVPALRSDGRAALAPEDYVERDQPLGHILREDDLATAPILAPVSGYLFFLGTCHASMCDVSLPAQHPYSEQGEKVATIVVV